MAEGICTTGMWVDTQTGQVVDTQPAEGRLLVAPGGVVTADVQSAIDRARASAPVIETAVVDQPSEDTTAVEEVETATEPKARETAAAPKRGR